MKQIFTSEVITPEVQATRNTAYGSGVSEVGRENAKHRLGWIAPDELSDSDRLTPSESRFSKRPRFLHMDSNDAALEAMNIAANYYLDMQDRDEDRMEARNFMLRMCPEISEFRRALNLHPVGAAALKLVSNGTFSEIPTEPEQSTQQ